jgi:hypothetical protein
MNWDVANEEDVVLDLVRAVPTECRVVEDVKVKVIVVDVGSSRGLESLSVTVTALLVTVVSAVVDKVALVDWKGVLVKI